MLCRRADAPLLRSPTVRKSGNRALIVFVDRAGRQFLGFHAAVGSDVRAHARSLSNPCERSAVVLGQHPSICCIQLHHICGRAFMVNSCEPLDVPICGAPLREPAPPSIPMTRDTRADLCWSDCVAVVASPEAVPPAFAADDGPLVVTQAITRGSDNVLKTVAADDWQPDLAVTCDAAGVVPPRPPPPPPPPRRRPRPPEEDAAVEDLVSHLTDAERRLMARLLRARGGRQ